jgi:hypothetical protein
VELAFACKDIARLLARWCRRALSEGRQDVPAGGGARAAAHRGLVGNLGRRQPDDRPADARQRAAAMTLEVYADLFDSDSASVAESVFNMWSRQANSHWRSARNHFYQRKRRQVA